MDDARRGARMRHGVVHEFVYRLPGVPGGSRPGMHASRAIGPGSAFAAHGRLFDRPDPRRLDLRASLASVPREWLVRVNRQRSSVTLQAIVDVSASMHFGADGGKLGAAIDFVRALGHSAFRSGDAAGLVTFDALVRDAPAVPPRAGRGLGEAMAEALVACRVGEARAGDGSALADAAERVRGAAVVFIVSDFHFPLDGLGRALERLAPALVVPLVVRDPNELVPPAANGWLDTVDAESGRHRPLWMNERTRRAWRENVARREAGLDMTFAAHDVRPLRLVGAFDAERLTRHFIETIA